MEEAKRRMETGKAIGGRTARPCDQCGRERAGWYCAADEAYLCESCDRWVHSANAVARRHERVRFVGGNQVQVQLPLIDFLSCGARASKRRRSTRPHPQLKSKVKVELEFPSAPVPENNVVGDSDDHDDDLLPHVPIFLPALSEEFGLPAVRTTNAMESMKFNEFSSVSSKESNCEPVVVPESDLHQFLESETDLFAMDMDMDMESIIGQGLGEDGLGVLRDFDDFARDVKVEENGSDDLEISKDDSTVVKLEEAEADQSWDTIEINIEYDDEEQDAVTRIRTPDMEEGEKFKIELDLGSSLGEDDKRISLKLNYEDVLSAWSDRGSLWASYDDCTSDLGGCHNSFEAGLVPDLGLNGGHVGPMAGMINCGGDQEFSRHGNGNGHGHGAREARVLRYREKRRTRLFSKKIRYEVRKLNAEKRPRMKGRFVKRTSGMSSD